EDLRIGSVFSLTDSSTCSSPAPTLAHMDSPASCSNCKQVLVDGKTVYQRKGHADIFCSSPCLLKFYQMKKVKKTCHFCLQLIGQPQSVLQAPVDDKGTKKDFCSQACLSSFNYKRSLSTKMPVVPVPSQSQCSMCSRYCISKHEIIQQDVVHKICSDPCFLRFCNMNNLSICENCHSRCNTPLMLRMENGSKKLCNAECLAQFKQKIKTPQLCAMCRTLHLLSDMLENKNSDDEVELFCTSSCVMASKIQAISASGTPLSCDRCGKTTLPACHLAMSDASIGNFCTLACAMSFKESQKDTNGNSSGAAEETRFDYLKPPEKLPCAQCRRIIKAPPKVIQEKGKMNFVCNWDCLQEFKKVNNIMGQCEYCKNEKIIGDVKKVDGKDCYFCSEGCLTLFRHELEDKWSEYCGSCAYCFSISKKVVTAKYEAIEEEFCSEECSSNYNKLVCS
ncbi:zinc finger MYM-type protein 4-like, partial [Plectropomus leopardus]|uniref:zinc finger MYM-type protein 4-like n=1 Tax=Plectropomus leopardus TaxID=160734 RepID=UPI001C4C2C98